jgi:hypothetical protein
MRRTWRGYGGQRLLTRGMRKPERVCCEVNCSFDSPVDCTTATHYLSAVQKMSQLQRLMALGLSTVAHCTTSRTLDR